MNITDPDSKLTSSANRGFLQGFSAQAVATENQVSIATGVTADGNDYAQLKPMVEQAAGNLAKAGVAKKVGVVLADAGYLSEDNLALENEHGVELVISTKNRRRSDDSRDAPTRGRIPPGYRGSSAWNASSRAPNEGSACTETIEAVFGVRQTSYGYDTAGRINSITEPFAGPATSYQFDDAGRQTQRVDPAGITVGRTYDAYTGRAATETVTAPDGTSLASFGASWDPAGNIHQLTQNIPGNTDATNKTWTYLYDAMNRLTKATPSSGSVLQYGYDGAGNRTSVQVGSGSLVGTAYDGADHPVSSGSTNYSFDPAGNLTSVSSSPNASQNWALTYDAWGHQTRAVGGQSGITINYAYDALGRMLNRTRAGVGTTYAYTGTGENPATAATAGSATVSYGYTPGGPVEQSQSGVVKVFEPNLHGDLALIASSTGSVTGSETYGPFGDKRTAQGGVVGDASSNYFSFQSQPTDPDTAFVDMGTRLYDPSQGRFTTQDMLFGDPRGPLAHVQIPGAVDVRPGDVGYGKVDQPSRRANPGRSIA